MLVWEKESLDKEAKEAPAKNAFDAMADKPCRARCPLRPPRPSMTTSATSTRSPTTIGNARLAQEGGADWDV
jgi:hypothetical protein